MGVEVEEVGEVAREEERVGEEQQVADHDADLCSPGSAGPAGPLAPQFGAVVFLGASAGFR